MKGPSIVESRDRETPDLRLVAERIDDLVREIGEFADPRARDDAAELVRLLMDLYGAGLERVLSIAAGRADGRSDLVEALCDDALVSNLLVLHGLHPVDLATRVRRGLDPVGTALGSRGVRVALAFASEEEVRVTVDSTGDLCGSTAAAVRSSIERAVADAAPDVQRVVVEVAPGRAAEAPLIQIQGLKGTGER